MKLFYSISLTLVMVSCSAEPKRGTPDSRTATTSEETFTGIDGQGNIIPTGKPFPATGRYIHPDSVSKPKTIHLKGQPKEVNAHPNRIKAGIPKEIQPPEKLPAITPGQKGIPLPRKVSATATSTLALNPKPVIASAPQVNRYSRYNLHYWNVENGMSSSNILSIQEDSRGFLWLGTAGKGLIRFDGQSFVNYTSNEGFPGAQVKALHEDKKGRLWIGTNNGLIQYDGKHFTSFPNLQEANNSPVHAILEDKKGDLWVGTNKGVIRYDGQCFTLLTTAEGLIHDWVFSIAEDSLGVIWFGTFDGLCRYDGRQFTHYTQKEGLPQSAISALLVDKSGNLWIGTGYVPFNKGEGICRFNGTTFSCLSQKEGLSSNSIVSILEDRAGNIWFGTYQGGANRYDGQFFTHITEKEGLSGNSVNAMLEDSQGNIWLGTWDGGINRYGKNKFTYLTAEQGLSNKRVRSIYADRRGHLWFGTWEGGVNFYDGQTLTHFTEKEGLSNDIVHSILEDRNGDLWFATWGWGGVNRFDGQRFTHFTDKNGLTGNSIAGILEDNNGGLWFCGNGLNYFDGEGFTQFTAKEGLSNRIFALTKDHQGHLWFATSGIGLTRYDGNSFTHFTEKEGLNTRYISTLNTDPSGFIWFGSFGQGLGRFDGQHFTFFTEEDGLLRNDVISIQPDSLGRIWVVTPKGVNLLVPPTIPGNTNPGDIKSDYKIYSFIKGDGLYETNYFTNSVCLDQENRIWWGSTQGVIMLDLDAFVLPVTPPKGTSLAHIEINQQFVDFGQLEDTAYLRSLPFGKSLKNAFDSIEPFHNFPIHLTLPHNLNHLTFYFSAIDWNGPHKIRYSFILEGLDENWSPLQAGPKVDYRNLSPGAYTLKVKAIGAAQEWTQPLEYTFTIHPPWWFSWWAYSLYALIVVSLLYVLYRFTLNRQLERAETRRLQELEEVKNRFYTNITHEFRTPLTIILGIAEKIAAKPGQELSKRVQMIRRNGRSLLSLVNQLMDLAKLDAGKLELKMVRGDVVQYLRYILESFRSYAEAKSIHLQFSTDEETLTMDYDPERLLNILSNLLANAVKFTPEGGTIRVEASITKEAIPKISPSPNGSFILKVNDTGMGIPQEKLPFIFDRFYQADDSSTRHSDGTGVGLALTRELVKLMGGKIEVSSKEGKGTEFCLALPIHRQAPEIDEKRNAYSGAALKVPLVAPEAGREKVNLPPLVSDKELPRALIVEDHEDVVKYLVLCMEDKYQLEVAYDGQEGIDKAFEIVPDIIVSDVMMPNKDGYELCRTLKQDWRTSHIPIVLLTAKADTQSKISGLLQGADAYLAKPFNEAELQVRLAKLLELRRRLREKYGSEAYFSDTPATSQRGYSSIEDEFIEKVKKAVEKHLDNYNLDVTTLCREIGISRTPLHNKLKALTGRSTTEFIRFIRLTKARELLLSSNLHISEIAFQTGFQNHNYFTRMFKELFQKSPTEYREVWKSKS